MPKIIHAADIHLDAPFSLFDVQKARIRREELREAFAAMILFAKEEKAAAPPSEHLITVDHRQAMKKSTLWVPAPTSGDSSLPARHDPPTARETSATEAIPPSRHGEHSDLLRPRAQDTVMAVARDSHPHFLTPESHRRAMRPVPRPRRDVSRFSFVPPLYHILIKIARANAKTRTQSGKGRRRDCKRK